MEPMQLKSDLFPFGMILSLKTGLNSLRWRELGLFYGITARMDELLQIIQDFEEIGLKHRDYDDKDIEVENQKEVQEWMRMVKNALHAADDFFDEISTRHLQLIRNNKVHNNSFLFSCTNQILLRIRISREIDRIRDHFHYIRSEFNMSQLKPISWRVTQPPMSNSSEYLFISRKQIIKDLTSDTISNFGQNVVLFCVHGLVESDVVPMLFNDTKVKDFFDVLIWVHVSFDFVLENIIKQILKSLVCFESTGQESLDFLLDKLESNLKDKRYFLVLEDVWHLSSEKWTRLEPTLMRGAQGSKVVVTTRNEDVTKVIKFSFFIKLDRFTHVESLHFLKEMVFYDVNYQLNPTLESLANKLVKKCRGDLRLIQIVAKELCGKYQESEWIDVLESDLVKLGVGQNLFTKDLKLSYRHLPPRVKQCFLYCSVYPKGWKIEKNELIQLWMAQGYLDDVDDKQQMENVGYNYVDILVRNHVFHYEKIEKSDDFNLDSFTMNEWMYDLALEVAGVDYFVDNAKTKPIHFNLCFSRESNNIKSLDSLDATKLRSIFLQRANDREIAQMKGDVSVILRCKRLRLLNLSHSSLKKLPDLTGELKHLRYLDLSWCVKLVSLPKSICNLVNLQTLKLTGCEKLEFSTNAITNLINLRHLEIRSCKAFEDMMPAGLGKLSSLQSLSNFYVVDDPEKKAAKLNELQNLNSLRGSLEISTLDQVRDAKLESQNVNLKDKKLLESLDLNWENQEKKDNSFQLLENLCPHENLKRLHVRWYPGDRFSNWLSRINYLSHISLFGFNNCKSLPPIEHLPKLKSLEISSMKELEYIDFEEVSSHTEATFFPSLEKLKFSGCGNFKGWKRLEGAQFSCLSQLTINKCPKLTYLPTFPNVKELQLCESTVKPLTKTLNMASASSSPPLSMLKSLRIEGKLADINVLPPKWTQRLTTSLKNLEIGDVDDLDVWFEDHFTSLQKVVVYGCDLKALPPKICDLVSLNHIKIMGCHYLASLPRKMCQLTQLVTLEIWDCPLLIERCQEDTGEDWHQISHVKNKILKLNLRH